MDLRIANIIPSFFENRRQINESGLWGKEVVLNAATRMLVGAPSGAGKTSLLHMLYGLQRSYKGEIYWGGIAIGSMNDETLSTFRQESISVVFQDMRLFQQLTAFENIEVKRSQRNRISREQVRQWMERLGIAALENQATATLSRGEQQRVAIIRALSQPFQYLLMDEPFSHLDTANRQKAIDLIDEQVRQLKAGMILTDLEHNHYFDYTLRLNL